MPPKRKAIPPAAEPEPKKRVTRSSTKKNAPTERAPAAASGAEQKAPKTTAKKTKGTRTPKSTNPASTKVPKPSTKKSKSEGTNDESPPSTTTSLTIPTPNLKAPIQCTLYPPPPQPISKTPLRPFDTQTLIFTHGAGGTLSAPAVVNFCSGMSESMSVLAFQGSMNLGSRVKGFHACLEYVEAERLEARKKSGGKTAQAGGWVVGGRSMGARAAVIAVNEVLEKRGEEDEGGEDDTSKRVDLVLVSYPLQGPKDVRDQILLDLPVGVKVLFIIGEKDAMCPLDLLEGVRKKMKAKSQLVVVRGADHGMKGGGAKAEKAKGEETGRVASKWLRGEMEDDVTYIGGEEDEAV